MANTIIKHDPSTAGSNRYKYTISGWFKRTTLAERQMFLRFDDEGGGYFFFEFKADDTLGFNDYDGGSSGRCEYAVTSRKFRDPNAYYNIILTVDSTQVSASNRVKIWVNGELQSLTSIGSEVCPSNYQTFATSGALQYVGGDGVFTTRYYGGVISHLHFCEGYAYDETDFGSTDSTTGEWKINTSPSVNYGTNGFFLFKDDNSLTDRSGQNNNFSTHSGTLTKTEDNPSNVFCVLNPLQGIAHPSYTNGNTKCGSSSDNDRAIGTIPSKAGYYEVKLVQAPVGGSGSGLIWGVYDVSNNPALTLDSQRWFKTNYGYDTHYATINFGQGNSWENQTTGLTASAGDILMMAWKNGKLYAGYNGTWFFGANPSTDTDGSVQMPLADANAYQAPLGRSNLSGLTNAEFNFGNGYFGTTAVTTNSGSGYSDSNGEGIFNYQPPTGTYACCTKNLNT